MRAAKQLLNPWWICWAIMSTNTQQLIGPHPTLWWQNKLKLYVASFWSNSRILVYISLHFNTNTVPHCAIIVSCTSYIVKLYVFLQMISHQQIFADILGGNVVKGKYSSRILQLTSNCSHLNHHLGVLMKIHLFITIVVRPWLYFWSQRIAVFVPDLIKYTYSSWNGRMADVLATLLIPILDCVLSSYIVPSYCYGCWCCTIVPGRFLALTKTMNFISALQSSRHPCFINVLRLGYTYMSTKIGSSLVQETACRRTGDKPSPEPLLAHCALVP